MVLFLQVGRRLLRLGCCAGRPSPLKVSCWVARKTHATFSPSLRCVSFVIEAVCSMACSVLARFTMFSIFFSQNSRCCLLLVVPLQGNDIFGGSTYTVGVCSCSFSRGPFRVPLRGTGLLVSCSRSTSLDSAFLQRRAPLPTIETQKSPWNVSGVDRRETGLFPGKKVTSLSGSFFEKIFSHFTLNKCFSPVKCLPCTASSASDLPRRSIWIPPRSTTCGPCAPPSPCLLV